MAERFGKRESAEQTTPEPDLVSTSGGIVEDAAFGLI